jgi:O-antigen ligase
MSRLLLIFCFFWIQLIENAIPHSLILWDFGNGLEIRLTLLLKVLALVMNLLVLLHFKLHHRLPTSFLALSGFLLLSTASVAWLQPSFFLMALAVNMHIQLMLNLAFFVYLQCKDLSELRNLMRGLRFFAMVNASLVILSFFFVQFSEFFETAVSTSGVKRAFGFMGDEVSVFLTFFLYEALIKKRHASLAVYFIAILCTAGIGAFVVTISLFLFYALTVMRWTMHRIYTATILTFFCSLIFVFYTANLSHWGVLGRIQATWKGERQESSQFRMVSLGTAADMIQKKPLWGTGFGAYAPSVRNHFLPLFKTEGIEHRFEGTMVIVASAFNPYVQMLCESGLVGFSIFVMFLWGLWRIFANKNANPDPEWQQHALVCKGWFLVFCVTFQSANWFLPASFLMLLIMTLVGTQLKINQVFKNELVPSTD